MTTIVRCARAVVDGEERHDFCFAIENDRIAAVGDADSLDARFPDADLRAHGKDVAALPGFINAHSHAYQILLRGWADDLPFERWRDEALYKIVPQLSPEQVYWTFRLAFDEMLAAGITTVAEFFYLNGFGNGHASAAIRAAQDAGIRLILARTWMDSPHAPQAFTETIDEAAKRTADLMREHPGVEICVAPHSLHAASPEMIRLAAEFAEERACMCHIHVAEAKYEGAQTLERFGATPIVLLDRLGALTSRLVAIHAIYITDYERRLLAESGARVVHNPLTNQYLGDGICDVAELQRLGVRTGLGTDADVKPSLIDEMRAASLLQKITHLDGSALGARVAFTLGTSQGAAALGLDAGEFREGAYADYVLLDLQRSNPWTPLLNLIVYRAENAWIRETYVSGRRVRHREDPAPGDALAALAALAPQLHL